MNTNFSDAREPLPEPTVDDIALLGNLCEFCGATHEGWPGDIGQLCQMCWKRECAATWGARVESIGVLSEPDLDASALDYLIVML